LSSATRKLRTTARSLTTQIIAENKGKPISFSQPIVWQKENPVFFPKTINVIQGKAGVHKSRLAETICAALA
jgi:predicted ATPase